MKKRKVVYKEDDGHTIYNMNVEGFRWYKPNDDKQNGTVYYTPKERFHLIMAAYKAYLIPFSILFLSFLSALLLIYFFWLK